MAGNGERRSIRDPEAHRWNAEIAENNYNLSVSTYIEKEDTRQATDIKALNKEIAEIVAREQVLREEIDKIIKEIEGE